MPLLSGLDNIHLLQTSKWVNSSLSCNYIFCRNLITSSLQKTRIQITSMQAEIINLKDSSSLFKKKDISEEAEFNKLVDEYIGKRKRIGKGVVDYIKNCKTFITVGNLDKQATTSQSTSFFSGFGGIFGYGSYPVETPETAHKKAKEDEAEVFANIAKTDKDLNSESISDLLTKLAINLRVTHPEKMTTWLSHLQLCFGMMYSSCLNLYIEAKEVEKLKDYLVGELEISKQALEGVKKINSINQNELKSTIEVIHLMHFR